jgi:hypothetical protein
MRLLPLLLAALAIASTRADAGPVSAPIPEETGEGFELIDPAALGFGFAGFTLDTTVQGQLDYDGKGGGALDLFEVRAIAPVGKINLGNWLLGATLNYSWTQADFGGLRGLGNADLQSIEATIVAAYRRADSPWWLLGFVSPGVSTDFNDVSGDAFNASALGLLGYRWNSRLDLAVGVYANYALGEATVLGSIGFIWRPNDRWIVQATPPIVAIGYRPTSDWTFGAVAYPGGGSWEVGDRAENVRQVDLSLWRAALSVEKKFGPHWRVSARGGIAFGGELELRDSDARVLADRDLDPAPFGAVAVRWAF